MDDELGAIVRNRPLDVPGVAIGLTIDDETRFLVDGVTNVDQGLPIDSFTLFQLGSVTKTFTATAALVLVDRGALSLDGLVSRELEPLELGDAAATLTLPRSPDSPRGLAGRLDALQCSSDSAMRARSANW